MPQRAVTSSRSPSTPARTDASDPGPAMAGRFDVVLLKLSDILQ
jgi:hypothetical protein